MSEEKKSSKKEFVPFKTTEEWDAWGAKGTAILKEIANDPERRFDLAKVPKERFDEIIEKAKERKRGTIYRKKLVDIIQPVYEGILSARLSKKEVSDLFVASFYMLVELTKNHRVIHRDIGIMWSHKLLRTLPFRYRFKMIPSKKFREICDTTNLFQYFRPRVTKKSKKFVDKRGDLIVDYESILKSFMEKDKEQERKNNYNKYTTSD